MTVLPAAASERSPNGPFGARTLAVPATSYALASARDPADARERSDQLRIGQLELDADFVAEGREDGPSLSPERVDVVLRAKSGDDGRWSARARYGALRGGGRSGNPLLEFDYRLADARLSTPTGTTSLTSRFRQRFELPAAGRSATFGGLRTQSELILSAALAALQLRLAGHWTTDTAGASAARQRHYEEGYSAQLRWPLASILDRLGLGVLSAYRPTVRYQATRSWRERLTMSGSWIALADRTRDEIAFELRHRRLRITYGATLTAQIPPNGAPDRRTVAHDLHLALRGSDNAHIQLGANITESEHEASDASPIAWAVTCRLDLPLP